MSEKDIIRTLAGVVFESTSTRLRIDAIRSLAAFLPHPDADTALHHVVSDSAVEEIRAEAMKALGLRGSAPQTGNAGRDLTA
jgi:hypothetical protein